MSIYGQTRTICGLLSLEWQLVPRFYASCCGIKQDIVATVSNFCRLQRECKIYVVYYRKSVIIKG